MCQALSEHQQQNVYCNSIITKKGGNSITISIKKPQKNNRKRGKHKHFIFCEIASLQNSKEMLEISRMFALITKYTTSNPVIFPCIRGFQNCENKWLKSSA